MALDTIPKQEGGKLKAVASGTLPSGKPVVVNSDGTVSVVAETSISEGVGTPVVFEAAASQQISSAYDPTSQKVVVSYQDGGNSNYGTAIVGTVSGTSISFGTPVVFEAANTQNTSTVYDPSSQKIVISYRDAGNSNYGTAVVGTVSGTSISFGTPVVFYSAAVFGLTSLVADTANDKVVVCFAGNASTGQAVVGTVSGTSISFGSVTQFDSNSSTYISTSFDTLNNKVVVCYRDGGNADRAAALVGTVSGTSISFGSQVLFTSSSTVEMVSTFDSVNGKIVVAYVDSGNADSGTAIVGTVSGTSISFGTPVVFESDYLLATSIVFDSNAGKVVVAYRDGFSSTVGRVIAGTVSGTSISFGAALTYDSDSERYFISTTFDSDLNKVVISYPKGTTFNGNSVVFQNASIDVNLTSENFIGISSGGAVADTGNATIDIVGTVNKEQSGLTAGQQYYVQTDGTIGTTPADPSVLAGTAVSATKMVVKS